MGQLHSERDEEIRCPGRQIRLLNLQAPILLSQQKLRVAVAPSDENKFFFFQFPGEKRNSVALGGKILVDLRNTTRSIEATTCREPKRSNTDSVNRCENR